MLNHKARPVKYQSARDYQIANFASRTMRWTGIIVLLFIVWHLLDLTGGQVNPDFVRGADVSQHRRQPQPRAGGDLLHPRQHRAWACTSSTAPGACSSRIGWANPRFTAWRRYLATGLATVVVVGNVSFPVAVLAGIVEI